MLKKIINTVVENFIPHPFSSNSTLSSASKKAELLSEVVSMASLLRQIISTGIVALVSIYLFNFPKEVIITIFLVNVVSMFVVFFVKVRKIKAIKNIDIAASRYGYKDLLITSEFYDLLAAVIRFIFSGVWLVCIYMMFASNIRSYADVAERNFSIGNILYYLIGVLILLRIIEVILAVIRYQLVKKIDVADGDFAKQSRQYVIIDYIIELGNFVPKILVLAVIFLILKIPLLVVGIFLIASIGIGALTLVQNRRMQNVVLPETNIHSDATDPYADNYIDQDTVDHEIVFYDDEEIIQSLFGILKTASGLCDVFSVSGKAILGAGKYNDPENTMLATNKRLLFIQVPVTGGNKIVGNTNYVHNNFFYNRGEIKANGTELLKTNTLEQILDLALSDVLYEDIEILTMQYTQINIQKRSGEKMNYYYMDKEYTEVFKEVFRECLGDRFIVK